ncbi:phragmoplastin interacting protein 1 [Silene latifolia]|uniref:phragmoplastin interacting protein 1 n=1 Tax=Silene latifolia TaxID=37657 RepID=UPI003D788537
MVLSRKKRQKLRAELNNNNKSEPNSEIPKTTPQVQNTEDVTGNKKRKRGEKVGEVSAKIKALLLKNVVVNGASNKKLKVDEKEVEKVSTLIDNGKKNEKKKKKKKKKKVKKKKKENKVVEEEEVKPQSEVQNVVISDQIVQENSKSNEGDVKKVYVGGMPYYSTEDDIRNYFAQCGLITDIDCMFFPETGKFRGIAIITFQTEEAAENALVLDGSDMDGLYLKIQPYKTTRPTRTSNFSPPVVEGYNRIYAGNLSWDITEDDLRKFFSDCNISAIRFGEDKETGDFKGYAHVDFADDESLSKALKLDQKFVCGRPVKISRAVPKKGVTASTMVKPKINSGVNPVKPENDSGINSAVQPDDDNGVIEAVSPAPPPPAPAPTENKSGVSSGKLKRRTCYDCGERGHISSDCPKKQNS